MTVFDLLGINPGDAIKVDNPWSDSGPRDVVPLALSRNGISIRAIDARYGDIRYVGAEWTIFTHDENVMQLQDFPYIKQKIDEWDSRKLKQEEARERAKEISLEEIEREFATLDEILNTIDIDNMKVAITGTLPISRSKVKCLLESKGAIVMGTVSKQTSFLFMGNTGRYEITSKMKKAHSLGVKIITL
ncbi:anti-phage protein GapS2 [Photobacterium alginatilyticum]|uniref:DNA ligase n=1 Tax=Photobacterium alginatilyticum TaxID=1775171 RepID=A0ABW9YQX4_9GAMM|nr:BRCT domain-containing protein [Photobacterium alginatilyticum]NBI56100.1 DNA ligase [Photobacterium alginatilyticum]